MEGIINIDKSKDIERCINIVKEIINEELTKEGIDILTREIMDTSLLIGGDFSDDNIRNLTKQYLETGGIERFKRAHKEIL